MRWFRRPRSFGARGEDLAAQYLRKQGYRILERNARLGRYEIDIIAREGDTVAFVEVKTRRTANLVRPEANVNRTKREHILKAAHVYMDSHRDSETYYRFDVVSVVLPENGLPEIVLFRDAFPGR